MDERNTMNENCKFAFFRKAPNLDELKSGTLTHPFPVNVIQVAELSTEDYKQFGENLLSDYAFIDDCKDVTYFDDDKIHCLLVKSNVSDEGILVSSEGYMYARYAAYVKDCSVLNLKDAPVVHTDLSAPVRPPRGWER